ncbi:RNA methyltransferase, putative [Plasmodium relictum]|uniref:RNA methyltransferase, putative n=1 Tax=Plasmodium relictum TaxID=85471 RepID=A0A1J1H989_PLARL|nr:RNA methyltransferase, putative [Plasmodium relictum]CRH00165.1 RNA methyltransferase, putative [Plasmodium relictum]
MNNSDSINNNKLNDSLKNNENNVNHTFSLFENDNFEINKSEDEYVSIEDDIIEDENELSDDEGINYDDAISDNITDDDMNNDYMSDDEDNYKKKRNEHYTEKDNMLKMSKEEKEQENEIFLKEENGMNENIKEEKNIDVNIIGLKKRMKKKYINKRENIYYDEIGVYKNNKVMKNEDIEDRMKYLLLLISNARKSNIKLEKSTIIKELLFYYSYYYEYSKEMIKYLNYLFDVKELYLFLELNNMPKEIHLRTNTLKITRSNLIKILKNQNISVEEGDKWNNVGIVLNDLNSNVGSLNEYLYGYYMIQSSSSFIPVLELNIQENDLVLDMCAAPGGKCTFICAIKKNKGVVYANDINKFRCKAIEAQASRMGINNLIITCIDALKIHKHLTFQFDKILLDAPCSGTGVVNKNKSARRKSIKEIRELAQKQRKLLNNAINLLKNGGIIVYSTCSITVEENEQVINYILKKRDVNLLPIDINIGDPGITHYKKKQFSSKISLCKRIYLHKHNHDNFFVAKLIKRSDAIFDKNKSIINKKEKNSEKKESINLKKSSKKNINITKENSSFHKKNKKMNHDNQLNNNKEVKKSVKFNNKKKEKHSNKLYDKKKIKKNHLNDKKNKKIIFKEKEENEKEKKVKNKKNKIYNNNTKSENKNTLLNESEQIYSKKENRKNNNAKNNLSIKDKKIQKKFVKNKKNILNKKNVN